MFSYNFISHEKLFTETCTPAYYKSEGVLSYNLLPYRFRTNPGIEIQNAIFIIFEFSWFIASDDSAFLLVGCFSLLMSSFPFKAAIFWKSPDLTF